jgi:raffinose/stachyose/melibiose transport system substrate-binding protein
MKRALRILRRNAAALVVAAVFTWACVTIASRRQEEAPPGVKTLRIGHWQLETSVREAVDTLAREYERLHPDVRIIQDAIPEMTYGQWLTTQLMGGTAPDLLEIGKVPYPLLIQYYNRYFLPVTAEVDRPNPYNRGTDLEAVPLRSTFKDGMRNAYVEEVQQFMSVPLSQFGVRLFFNRDLLHRLTGLTVPPTDYRDFMAACEQIRAQRAPSGQPYVPIACSRDHLNKWEISMLDPLTYPLMREADFNRDGFVGNDEMFVAVRTGRLSFTHPAIAARFRMLRELSENFQRGYTGLTREEALFLFSQQRAVFMGTGSWDARSIISQTEGAFEVGVMDYPQPAADDPVYGPFVNGPNYERMSGGFAFSITRTCRHPEAALDFLLFLTGQAQNERLNAIIGWIPSVRGTRTDPLLQPFDPHLRGVYGCFSPIMGGETQVRWTQLYSLFQVGQIEFDDLATQYEAFYRDQGLKDFMEQQRDWRRGMQNNEQVLAGIRAAAIAARSDEAPAAWVRYRVFTGQRQIWPEVGHARQVDLVSGKAPPPDRGPYVYGEATLERIRTRLARTR